MGGRPDGRTDGPGPLIQVAKAEEDEAAVPGEVGKEDKEDAEVYGRVDGWLDGWTG